MEIGVLYLSHAMLVLAELIVCSTRGFACILAKWFWPTEISLSFTYGSPEASCNKRADTYLGRRSASLMKEFWTLCIFVMTVSETVMVETIPYSNIGLKHQACVNTVFVHKLKQEGIEIALLVSHWLIFLTNQQTKGLAPNYNPK